jgi:hypothetical protein
MPKIASVFESLSLLLPVTCSCCEDEDKAINLVFIPVSEEDVFYEGWGQGSEDPDTDTCEDCDELGVLEDALGFFFFDGKGVEGVVFGLRMNIRLIETMTRLIQERKEERIKGEKVYLAIDAPCECDSEIRVFRLGQQSDNNDFANKDWDFDKPPFVETNKAVIVDESGAYFSCDISTTGKDRVNLGTVVSRSFSLEDLAYINGWLAARGAGADRKVADDYEDGACPDCQKKIPKNAKYGDSCSNCGHVFNSIVEPNDDAE